MSKMPTSKMSMSKLSLHDRKFRCGLTLNVSANAAKVTEELMTAREVRPADDLLPNDIDKYSAMYANSLFYKDFKERTFKQKFQAQPGQLNAYFSVQFADVFLKKYISILCLWTCLTQDERSTNSCVEANFRITKDWLFRKQLTIGKMPVKPGRFMNELKIMNGPKVLDILRELPRDRCRKRHLVDDDNTNVDCTPKKARVLACKNFLDIYKSFPKTPKTPQTLAHLMKAAGNKSTPTSTNRSTPKTSSEETVTVPQPLQLSPKTSSEETVADPQPLQLSPKTSSEETVADPQPLQLSPKTSIATRSKASRGRSLRNELDQDLAIDNPYVEEQWCRRKKNKNSYMDRKTLKAIQEDKTNSKIEEILLKPNNKQTKKGNDVVKLRNGLYDDPEAYIKPEVNFVVATEPKSVLFKVDYESIKATPTTKAMEFVFRQLQLEYDHIQIESITSSFFDPTSTKTTRFEKDIFFGVNFKKSGLSLLIINFKKKEVTLMPATSSCYDSIIDDFELFIQHHNQKYKNQIDATGWQRRNFDLTTSQTFSELYMLKCLMEYVTDKEIGETFEEDNFRQELLHYILRNSTKMTSKCLFCGFRKVSEDAPTATAVQCNICKRWTHLHCANLNDNDVIQATFLCLLCSATVVKC